MLEDPQSSNGRARVSKDEDGRPNLRLWETIAGCDPLLPDCYLQ